MFINLLLVIYYLFCLFCFLALRKRLGSNSNAIRGYKIILLGSLTLPIVLLLAYYILTFPEEKIVRPSNMPLMVLLFFFKLFLVGGFIGPFWTAYMGSFLFFLAPVFSFENTFKGMKFEELCEHIDPSVKRWARVWFTSRLGLIAFSSFLLLLVATEVFLWLLF